MSCPEDYPLGLDWLKMLVGGAVFSPYVKHEKPCNLIIIAPPSAGKTTVLKLFSQIPSVIYVNSFTTYSFLREYAGKLANGEKRTIIIPDFMSLVTFSAKDTKDGSSKLIKFLSGLVEEGVEEMSSFYFTISGRKISANVLTCLTPRILSDKKHKWSEIGFLSRFIPISYHLTDYTKMKIIQWIKTHDRSMEYKIEKSIPREYVDVELPAKYEDEIMKIVEIITKDLDAYPFRPFINIMSLVKGMALFMNKTAVDDEVMQWFKKGAKYINLALNEI
jgi:hypothetical protein